MKTNSPVLTAKNLRIGYKKKTLSSDLQLSLWPGEVVALIGRNGIGKSTLIKTLTGNIPSISGEINLKGKSLKQLSKREIAKLIALVVTDPGMTSGLRLKEMVALGRIPHTGHLGFLKDGDRRIIENALHIVNMDSKAEEYYGELSDGERQKGLIARGLAQDTLLLIMDEPFSFLDVASRMEILFLLKEIAKNQNKSILFSSHDISQALRLADKIWICNPGNEGSGMDIYVGSPQEIIDSELINKLFDNDKVYFNKDLKDFVLK